MTIASRKAGSEGAERSAEQRGRGRPPARTDDETRAVIYDAARQEFAGSGFAATCMDSVAKRAGISTKTLYRLIPNKGALFEAALTNRMDRFASVVRLRACDGSDIEAALREALLVCADLMLNGEVIALQRMLLAESDKFPDIAETFYNSAMQRTVATLAKWLRTQQERGLIELADTDAGMAAGMLLGMLTFEPQRAVMFGHKPVPSRNELEMRARACAALFLRGCGRVPP